MSFAAPRDLRAVSPVGDTVTLGAISALYGDVQSGGGDTLATRVGWAQGANTRGAGGSRLAVVPSAGDQVAVKRFSGRRTSWLVVGLGTVAIAAALIAAMSALDDDLDGVTLGY